MYTTQATTLPPFNQIVSQLQFHPVGDVLCILFSREMWYRKSALPSSGAG